MRLQPATTRKMNVLRAPPFNQLENVANDIASAVALDSLSPAARHDNPNVSFRLRACMAAALGGNKLLQILTSFSYGIWPMAFDHAWHLLHGV
jgi:hypothetical protein